MSSEQKRIAEVYATNKDLVAIFNEQSVGPKRLQILKWIKDLIEKPKHAHKEEEKLSGLEVEPATIVEIKNGDMEHRMCYFNKMLETLLFEFNVARQKDGNIYVRSLTFKRWKERKVRLDEDQNVFIIYSKKKEKKLNLTTYSVKWVGQKKEYQAFSLDSVSAQNKYKQLLFGWVNFDGARVWHDSILRLLSKIPGSTVPLNREAMSIQVQSSQALFNQNMNQSVIVASSNLKPHEQITQSAYQPQIKRKASLNMEEQLEKAEKPTESLQLNIQSKANKKEENELKKAPSQQLPTSESSDNESPGLKSQRQHQQKEVINVNSVSNATQQVQKYPNLKETAPATANNATQNSQTNEKKQLEQKEQHQQQQQIQQQQQQQQQIQQQQQQQQQQHVEKQQPQLEKKENSQAQQQPINTNIQQQNTSTERNGNISSPQKESQQPPQQVEKKEVIKVQAQVQEQQIQQHQEAPSHQNGIEQKQEQHQPQQSQEEQKQQQQQQKQQQKESKQQQKQASELVDYHLEHLDDIKTPQTVSDFLSEYKLSSITDERDFKTVSFNNGMRLLQSTEDPRRFKILIAFQGVSCFEIFNCISNVDDYSKWNSNVAETRVLNIMKNEQTAILYQKHKGIGIMYRPRDFVYLRHAFVKDQQYYIVDKSVEYDSLPSSISIVRGEIEHVVWCFQTHPQDEGRSLMIADLYYSNSGYSNKEQDASITFAYLNNFSNLTTFITQKTFQKSIAINMFDVADQSQLKRSQIRAQEREEKSQKPVQQDSHQQQHSELSNQVIGSNVSVSSSVQPQSVESHNQEKHLLQVENQQPIQQARKEMTKTEENCEDTQPSSNSNINIKTSQEQIEDDEKSQMRHIYEEEEQQNAQLNSELNKFSEEIHKDDTEYTLEVTNQVAPQIDLLNENVFNQPGDKLAGMTIMEIIDFVNKNKHWGICVDQKYNMGRIDGPSKFLESTQERGHYQFKKDWDRDTKTGKFIFLNKEKIATQKKVISFLLSKIGSNILSGKSITSISLPIDIFEPRSNLERFAYASSFAPIYLKRAAESSDPVEQMKNCAVYLITTTIMYLDLEKPFNPILGETYQGRLDGYPIYCEQISHHPPICSYSYYTDGYKLQGNLESIASMHANSVTGINQGNVFVKFYKTGNEIGLIQAPGSLNGTAFGTRYMSVDGKYLAYDIKNKLVMDLKVNPDKKGFFKSAGNTIDYMAGGIYRVTDKFITKLKALKPHYYKFQGLNKDDIIGEPLSVITGIWNQEVLVDGVKWYDLQSPLPYKLEHELNPIPSDCNYRQDILYLKDRNLKEGQITKEVLENYQRADRKLREKAHELRKKALKKLKK